MGILGTWITELWTGVTGPEFWLNVVKGLVEIVLIFILAMIVIRIGKKIIGRIFSNKLKTSARMTERREKTLRKLIENALVYVVYFTAFVMVLEVFGLPITSLIAGAGVLGLAIGFGAQSLVSDIITGFFIIFEDQFSVGDYIYTDSAEGTVEEIGIRTTRLRSWTGETHVFPNGNVKHVINYSVSDGLAVVDINIPYEADINRAEGLIEDIIQDLDKKYDTIIAPPTIHGVQTLDTSHFVIRVIAESLPVYQWSAARSIRKEVKEHLYDAGIDIPSPRVVLYSRNETPTQIDAKRDKVIEEGE